MAKHTNLTSLFSDIADAIRAKKGTTGTIVADNFPDEIAGIEAGSNIPAVTQATPVITVSSSGLITATATQSEGHVAAGTKTATKQLTTKSAATITPGTSDQTIAAGTYLTGTQTIKAKNGFFAAGTVGSTHSKSLTFSVEGINNRYPTHIILYSATISGELHGDEVACTAMIDLYIYQYSGGTYVGEFRYNSSGSSRNPISTSNPVTVTVTSNSITLTLSEHCFYGEYKAAIIC